MDKCSSETETSHLLQTNSVRSQLPTSTTILEPTCWMYRSRIATAEASNRRLLSSSFPATVSPVQQCKSSIKRYLCRLNTTELPSLSLPLSRIIRLLGLLGLPLDVEPALRFSPMLWSNRFEVSTLISMSRY